MRQNCSQLCVFHLIHSIYKYIYKYNPIPLVRLTSGTSLDLDSDTERGARVGRWAPIVTSPARHLHQDQNCEGLEDNQNHDDEDHDDKVDEDDEDDEDADQNVG